MKLLSFYLPIFNILRTQILGKGYRTNYGVLGEYLGCVIQKWVQDRNYVRLLHSYGNLCPYLHKYFPIFLLSYIINMPHHFPTMDLT
jgi:hypothetical protein